MLKLRLPPVINDISNSFDPVPEFHAIKRANPNLNLEYPREFQSKQEKFYLDFGPLDLDMTPGEVFRLVKEAASRMRDWEVVGTDESALRLEGTATTRLMRFKDDFVIEVRPNSETSSRVCMRSKSRVGKGDLGANADRITAFLAVVKALSQNRANE